MSGFCNQPSRKSSPKAFTLVELLTTIAIAALLVALIVPMVANYVSTARQTADEQTLLVLNDAINRYKMQGGDLNALTAGKHYSHLLDALSTPVNWNGVTHQFLLGSGNLPTATTVQATGSGRSYRLTGFNSYTGEAGGSTVGTGQYFLLSEDAEGTGTPSGWTNNTGINGNMDWDYTTSAIEGSQSLRGYSTNSGSSSNFGATWTGPFPAHGTVIWFYTRVRVLTLPAATRTATLVAVRRISDDAAQFNVVISDTGWINFNRGDGATIGSLNASSFYNDLHIWMRKNSDSTADIWVSNSATRSETPDETIPAWNTGQVGSVRYGIAWGGNALFDHIRVSDTEIGSNPE